MRGDNTLYDLAKRQNEQLIAKNKRIKEELADCKKKLKEAKYDIKLLVNKLQRKVENER